MKKLSLVIHIGDHKTGTTSFQKFCTNNSGNLLKSSILYPSSGINKFSHDKFVSRFINYPNQLILNYIYFIILTLQLFIESVRKNNLLTIISSERFIELLVSSEEVFNNIISIFCLFYKVKIIRCNRPVLGQACSGFKHLIRILDTKNFDYYHEYFNVDPFCNKEIYKPIEFYKGIRKWIKLKDKKIKNCIFPIVNYSYSSSNNIENTFTAINKNFGILFNFEFDAQSYDLFENKFSIPDYSFYFFLKSFNELNLPFSDFSSMKIHEHEQINTPNLKNWLSEFI